MNLKTNLSELEQMAKFRLSDSEKEEVLRYMNFLADDFNCLAQVKTDGVMPLIHGIELQNRFREDVTLKTISREKLLENAPEQHDGYFKVPKTLE